MPKDTRLHFPDSLIHLIFRNAESGPFRNRPELKWACSTSSSCTDLMVGLHSGTLKVCSGFAFVHGELNLRAGIIRTQQICGRRIINIDFPSGEVSGFGNRQRWVPGKPCRHAEEEQIWAVVTNEKKEEDIEMCQREWDTLSLNTEWLCVRKPGGQNHPVEKKKRCNWFHRKKASSHCLWL